MFSIENQIEHKPIVLGGGLRIGELAEAAGVGVETIRYYEAQGILEQPPKPQRGARTYPTKYVGRIRFVKFLQSMGFTLNEIKDWMRAIGGSPGRADIDVLVKLVASKAAELDEMKEILDIKAEILRNLLTVNQNFDGSISEMLKTILGLFQLSPNPPDSGH